MFSLHTSNNLESSGVSNVFPPLCIFGTNVFCFFLFVPTIIVIAINSICVPRCFSTAAAALALQKTNIHRRRAQSSRAVMRGGSLPLSCVTVLKSLHGELINFFSASSVLVCLRKTKTARVPGVSGSTHPPWCHLLCSHYFSLPSSVTSTPPPRSPCNPHFQRVPVSPSATCEGSLVAPSLNK